MQRLAVPLGQRLLADAGVRFLAQLLLGLFGGPPQARLRGRVSIAEIDSVPFLKFPRQTFDEKIVEIVSSQAIVAVTGEYFRDVALHGYHGNVERAASQIVYQGRMPGAVAVAISEAGCGGFVQDADHFAARP